MWRELFRLGRGQQALFAYVEFGQDLVNVYS
jgi:hypothetical protein